MIFYTKKWKKIEEYEEQSKNFDRENRRLEHRVELLKNPNDVCKCIIALYSFSIGKEKIDRIISVVLSKLAKKDIERFQSGCVKAKLINAMSLCYLK